MFSPLFGAAVIVLGIAQQADTTIAVRQGTRLDVENVPGEVVVRAWDRDAVRITADRPGLDIRTSGSVLWLRSERHRGTRSLDVRIEVPAWMAVRITGPFTDATVQGTAADITIETVRGEILVRGGSGRLQLNSVQGGIHVEDARGRVEAVAANDDIIVRNVTGDIAVENVNGDIQLEGIDSRSVTAGTVNGDVSYSGTIREDGRYRLASHNGDISITIPANVGATIGVATFSGEFQSDFPVQLDRAAPGRRFNFVIGSGRARIDLGSFNGEIRLRRPNTPIGRAGRTSDGAAVHEQEPTRTP